MESNFSIPDPVIVDVEDDVKEVNDDDFNLRNKKKVEEEVAVVRNNEQKPPSKAFKKTTGIFKRLNKKLPLKTDIFNKKQDYYYKKPEEKKKDIS